MCCCGIIIEFFFQKGLIPISIVETLLGRNITLTEYHGGDVTCREFEYFTNLNSVCQELNAGMINQFQYVFYPPKQYFSEMIHRNSVPRVASLDRSKMRRFVQQLIASGEQWKSMKMVVLGNGRIGKTTLLNAFDEILHPDTSLKVWCPFFLLFLFRIPALITLKEAIITSTIGVDCSTINPAGGEVTVWDFAGQQEYTVTHQFFLSLEVCLKIMH